MSPFVLLQEIYIDDPWKIMVCCILLNQTTRKQVDKVREELFEKWSTPEIMASADIEELREVIRPLGFYNKRSKTLVRFSKEWNDTVLIEDPSKLHGIGQYAKDSWTIFVEHGEVKNPSDHVLKDYVKWQEQNLRDSIITFK